METSIDNIPDNILALIFSNLSQKDLTENLIVVCKKFSQICKDDKQLRKKVWMWLLWGEREVPPQIKSKTIYIGNIARDVKEEEIYRLVPNPEAVTSVRIVAEKHKFHSPSYAYINFLSVEEAEKILPLTFTELHGKRIICNFKQIETSKHNICNVGNIYIDKIGDRTPKMEEEMLASLLKFGEILSLRVESKRAFIQYASKESAVKCVLAMDEQMMGQTKIEVRPFVSKERRKVTKKIFLRNVSDKTSREKLISIFSKFGKVLDCKILLDYKFGEKICWVEFPYEAADKILSKMPTLNLDGNVVSISESKEQSKKLPINFREFFYSGFQCNVYINNLHERVTEKDLENCFSRFGEIVSLKIARDDYRRSRGFAYICYKEPQQALLAIDRMHNQTLHPGRKKLNVTIWQPKEARVSSIHSSYCIANIPHFNPNTKEHNNFISNETHYYNEDSNFVPNDPNFYNEDSNFAPNDQTVLAMNNDSSVPMYEYMVFPPHNFFPPGTIFAHPSSVYPNYSFYSQNDENYIPPHNFIEKKQYCSYKY